MTNAIQNSIAELVQIVAELRNPVSGCPWDIEQTHVSLIPYAIEEAHEVANAIRLEDDTNLCEELGDLLLQVVLHAQLASDRNSFCLTDVIQGISKKLIRRHPHVFDTSKTFSKEEIKKNWEAIKKAEHPELNSKTPFTDRVRKKIRSQPAIAGSMYISQKVASLGFEWSSIKKVWEKVDEEIKELKEALDKKNYCHAEVELGDTLFTLINIARWYKLNPEEGLTEANIKFLNRFSYIESALKGNLDNQSIHTLENLWEEAKNI